MATVDSMALLELLQKCGMDGDVDFLREATRTLVQALMDAEVRKKLGHATQIAPLTAHFAKVGDRIFPSHKMIPCITASWCQCCGLLSSICREEMKLTIRK